MGYILTDGNMYCNLGMNHKIIKTSNISDAYIFEETSYANWLLNRASKKLMHFSIVQIDSGKIGSDRIDENSIEATKRIKLPNNVRTNVYNSGKGKCAICGKKLSINNYTIDHIVPLSKGGTNNETNLQCACLTCNRMKQDMISKDFEDVVVKIVIHMTKKARGKKEAKKLNKSIKRLLAIDK